MTNKEESEVLYCQNCHLPLQLDLSLLDLSLSQRNLVINSIGDQTNDMIEDNKVKIPTERLKQLDNVIILDKVNLKLKDGYSIDKGRLTKPESYPAKEPTILEIEKSQLGSSNQELESSKNNEQEINVEKTLSTQISTLSNIFNILSSKSSIDYPVCKDCCYTLIQKLKQQYNDILQEKEVYSEFLERLKQQQITKKQQQCVDSESSNDVISEKKKTNLKLDSIKEERETLFKQLTDLEDEESQLDQEILELKEKLKLKQESEARIIDEMNIETLSQLEFQKDLQNLKNQHEYALNNLDLLRKTNIYNETFKISHLGPFGTINGLKLGGTREMRVSWREINAALGQVVLLLSLLSKQLNYHLKNYKLEPLGSFSKISKYDESTKTWTTLETYYDENFKFTKLFHRETNFDKSLVCLLDIIQQLSQYILGFNSGSRHSSITSLQNQSVNSIDENLSDTTEMFRSLQINCGNDISNSPTHPQPKFSLIHTLDSSNKSELPYVIFKDKINSYSVCLYGNEPTIKWTTAMKFLLTDVKWLLLLSTKKLSSLH